MFLGSNGTTNSLKNGKIINKDTIFELASVSKQFTSYATLIALEKSGISIDCDFQKFIPNFPYKGIKVRNLLNHTSGIPDYIHIFQKKWNKDLVATNADVLEYFRKFKPDLKFKPTHDWEYSNTGYVFLSLLIEFLTDNSFSKFLTENIFHPIDMKNSRICDGVSSKNAIPNFALGKVFDFNKNSFEYPEGYTEYEYVTFLDGIQEDGAIKMSAPDLLRWNNELLELNFIGDELCNLMFTKSRIINKIEID